MIDLGPNDIAHYSSLHICIFAIHSHCFFINSYHFVVKKVAQVSLHWSLLQLICQSWIFLHCLQLSTLHFPTYLNLSPLVIPQPFSVPKFLILFPLLCYWSLQNTLILQWLQEHPKWFTNFCVRTTGTGWKNMTTLHNYMIHNYTLQEQQSPKELLLCTLNY